MLSALPCVLRLTLSLSQATPLILDLTILAELLTRVSVSPHLIYPSLLTNLDLTISRAFLQYRKLPSPESPSTSEEPFQPLYSVLSLLSYMLKAPLVKKGDTVVNSLARQRTALEQFLKGEFSFFSFSGSRRR